MRLALLLGPLPAVDRVGRGQAVFLIVAADVVVKGVGHNAHEPAIGFLPLHDLADAGVGGGDVVLYPGLPVAGLLDKILIRHAVAPAAHGHEARVEVQEEVFVEAHALPGVKVVEEGLKAGVVYRGGGVDHRVVVVKNEAFVFHLIAPFWGFSVL